MWPVLRTELAYARSYILGGLGLGFGIAMLNTAIFAMAGPDGPPAFAAAGIRGMYLIMAPLITAFVIQGFRLEERRWRLLLATPASQRQVAGAMVLVPVAMLAVGLVAAAAVFSIEHLLVRPLAAESVRMAGYVAGLLFMMCEVGLMVQEAVAARRQGRRRAAFGTWALFVLVVLALGGLPFGAAMGKLGWGALTFGSLALAAIAMAATIALFAGRTDFTR